MQLSKFAYQGKGAAQSRPKPPPRVGTARWDALDNDALHEIVQHFDDRGLGRLARLDRRTRRVAYAATKAHLGLGDSQWEVFKAVLHRRENVLLMGSPGTGKSFLLKVLRDRMPRALVTASTGAAAEKIGSFTLHSALGLGLGDKPVDEIVKMLKRPSYGIVYRQPCATCDALIIDEVSMLTAKTLDLAADVILAFRKKLPQLVVSGDPMQLGAVGAEKDGAFYASKLVSKLRPYVLTESFRQTEDSKFLSILNRARLGCAREHDRAWLVANASADVGPDAPRLFSKNHQVWEYNTLKLATIQAQQYLLPVEEWGKVPKSGAEDHPFHLLVKEGARVMLTSNAVDPQRSIHNGSCGVVTGIEPGMGGSIGVRFDNGKYLPITRITHEYKKNEEVVGTRTMYPLILAWAVSIHRAQGATLDRMATDLSQCFAKGQAYVALSRVREIQHLQLQGELKLSKLNNVDKKALCWYEECQGRSEQRAKRHRERDKQTERDAYTAVGEGIEDEALNAMMDAFEARRA
jgi:ATP-dependent DNA helicase PIF1